MQGKNIPSGQGIRRTLEEYEAAAGEAGWRAGGGRKQPGPRRDPRQAVSLERGCPPHAGPHVGKFSPCQAML